MATPSTGKILRLTATERFNLMTLIKEEYASSKMTDEEFAAYAQEKLKAKRTINRDIVKAHRIAFEIPANGEKGQKSSNAIKLKQLEDAYVALSDEVADLKKLVIKMQESCRLAGVKMAP